MRYNNFPKRTDKSISYDAWNNINKQVRKGLNLSFDPTAFTTQEDSSGTYVSIVPATKEDDFEYHFQGVVTESNVAANIGTLEIHGGISKRYSNSDVYVVPLQTDSGPSEHYEDVFTLSNVTSNCYVYAELDSALTPSSLTIANTASDVYPDTDPNEYTIQVLGHTNCDSGVLTWEPYWTGGDYTVEGIIPDSHSNNDVGGNRRYYSQEFSTRSGHEGELEDYGWSNTSSQELDDNDYIMVKTVEDPGGANEIHRKRYCTLADLANSYGVQVTVVVDVQYDYATHQIQKKTRPIWVLAVGDESIWTEITGGQATVCDPD